MLDSTAVPSRLEMTDGSVEFSGLKALDRVSLRLDAGEILGLIGPNGSGKTTMINAITGQVPLTSGEVRMDGRVISGLSPRRIALMGVARSFQIVRLFNNMTTLENIETAPLAHGESRAAAREKTDRLLCEFGLERHADDLCGTLSYGDKRRVEIARALAAEPKFLFLDEPAAGMNQAETDALLEILRALPAERGLGLLIIDHDMSLIMRLCRRLQVLSSGRTIAEGSAEEVRGNQDVIEAYLGSGADA
ncbi:ABC transporter ATP-binding protein [Pikeienuella piscinae]|uniref:ABC transporter ATP-binding protein n=1 Tax=Pikeienuella piscinae TaxID=2748098 RepID=A0A7L5C0E6_9RHOB|nr:ABC transporter ATP-binding protein [Pikeienuella piscinae]QIE55996.1 ABC transporter ATP-binding protein [Pikeienuella piscinae]